MFFRNRKRYALPSFNFFFLKRKVDNKKEEGITLLGKDEKVIAFRAFLTDSPEKIITDGITSKNPGGKPDIKKHREMTTEDSPFISFSSDPNVVDFFGNQYAIKKCFENKLASSCSFFKIKAELNGGKHHVVCPSKQLKYEAEKEYSVLNHFPAEDILQLEKCLVNPKTREFNCQITFSRGNLS